MMREQQPEIREKPPETVGASRTTDLGAKEIALRWLTIALVPGLLFTVLGPLGTYDVPLWQRAMFWIPTMAIGALAGGGISILAGRNALLARNAPLRIAVIAGALTAFMTLVVMLASSIIFGTGATHLSPTLVFYVAVITVTMSAIGYLSFERQRRVEEASAPPVPLSAPQHPALVDRLPISLRNQPVLALQAEDHYVRVYTPAGSDLILIRLTDAVGEMTPVTGARTHRSWWVNRSAIERISRRNGSVSLFLTNGLEVPVGRSYAGELREAGWLDG